MIYEEEPYFLEPIIRPFKQLYSLLVLVCQCTTLLCFEVLKAITSPYAFSGLVLVVHIAILLELQFKKSSVIQSTFLLERVVKDLVVYAFPPEQHTNPESLRIENTEIGALTQKVAVVFQLVGFYLVLVVYTTLWVAICSYVGRWRIARSSVVVNLATREVAATIAKDEHGYFVLSPGTEQDPRPWKIRLDQRGVSNIATERVLLPMQTAPMKVGAGLVKEMAIPNSYVEVVADFPKSCAILHNGDQGSANLRNCVSGTAFKMKIGNTHLLFTAAHVFKQLHETKDEQGKPRPVYLRVWRDREKCVKDFRLPRDIVFHHYSPPHHADLISMALHPDLWSALGLKSSVPGRTPRAGAPIEVYAPDTMSHWTKASGRIEKVSPGFQLEHTASTASGTSGSPIFNNGRVVGIHTGAHLHRVVNSATATTTLLTDFRRESSTEDEGVDPYALQEFEERVNSARQDMLTMLETKKERRYYVSQEKSVMFDKSRSGAPVIAGKSWADMDTSDDEDFFNQDDQDYLDGFDEEAKHSESSVPGNIPIKSLKTTPDFPKSLVGSRVTVIKGEEVPPTTSQTTGEKPSTNLQSPDMQALHGMLAQIKEASDSLQLYLQLQVPGASSLAEQLQACQATLQAQEAKISQQKQKRRENKAKKKASKASKTGTNPGSTQEQRGIASQAKPPAEPKVPSPLN
jgi:hypothetical protein